MWENVRRYSEEHNCVIWFNEIRYHTQGENTQWNVSQKINPDARVNSETKPMKPTLPSSGPALENCSHTVGTWGACLAGGASCDDVGGCLWWSCARRFHTQRGDCWSDAACALSDETFWQLSMYILRLGTATLHLHGRIVLSRLRGSNMLRISDIISLVLQTCLDRQVESY